MKKAKYWIGIVLFIVAYFAYAIVFSSLKISANETVAYMADSFILVVMCIVFLLAFGLKDSLRFSLKSCGEGIVAGGAFVAITAFYLIYYMIKAIMDFGTPLMETKEIILFVIAIFIGAGCGEEFLTRGVLFNFFRSAIGNTKAGIITAMTMSSLAFGAIHLTNLHEGVNPAPIYAQILYAIGIGFLINAIYIRCGNIWLCAVLHAIFDLALMNYYLIFRNIGLGGLNNCIAEWLGPEAIILKGFAITVITFAIGLFLIRDSKLEKCIERYEEG